jgi:hypothetical protein
MLSVGPLGASEGVQDALELDRTGRITGRTLDEGNMAAVAEFARISAGQGFYRHGLAILMRLIVREHGTLCCTAFVSARQRRPLVCH